MAPSTHVQSLVDRHQTSLSSYQPPPTITQLSELWATNPSLPRTVIISCADPRCHPESIFNLDPSNPSDAAIVIRVQGGDFLTALPALLSIDHLINFTDAILLKHTDCGTSVFRDQNIKTQLKERTPGSAGEIESMRFGENTISMQESVKRDLKLMQESALVSEAIKKNCTGMLFHLESGEVEIVA